MKLLLIIFGLTSFNLLSQNQMNLKLNSDDLTLQQKEQVLEIHNQVRNEVGVEDLKWSDELAAYAQEWADSLAESGCKMTHRTNTDKGENLYWVSRVSFQTPMDAVYAWYSEKAYFQNQKINADNVYEIGHYTQMIWKSTREVGMGMAVCKNGGAIVVANYDPPGNYLGERAY